MMRPIFVDTDLYRGPRPESADDLTLLFFNFQAKTIVSLETGFGKFWDGFRGRSFHEQDLWDRVYKRTFLSRPCSNFLPPTRAETTAILDDIKASIQKGAVYVHCYAGVDRTGWIIAAWRVREQGWQPEKAWLEAVQMGMHSRYWWWHRHFVEAMCA
jgi:hypothetical protein